MDRATYEVEADVQRRHWWFAGRRLLLRALLAPLRLPAGARVLDVGCGTGANLPVLAEGGRLVVGIDGSAVPLGLGAGGRRVRGDAARLPFATGAFDVVVALDVLEHLDDDAAAVTELRRVARPGGALVLFVPALSWLWGLQDDVSHHRRRYGREELRRLVAGGGLGIERLTFFNGALLAPILLARVAMRVRPPAHLRSENEVGGPLANAVLARIFAAEAAFVARHDLPIGVSLACVARAPGAR